VKSATVDIVRPDTLEDALDLLAGERDAQILAGGQSLVVSLNMRLSAPDLLIDINHLPGLDRIERDADEILIGPLVRHAGLAASGLVAREVPLLAAAMEHVAHPAVRNRGTICGSLAYADPAAELPAVAVALDARLDLRSARGSRTVRARDFFKGLFETDRSADEMITAVRFPVARADEVFGFDEVTRRHGDFAIVGMAARGRAGNGRLAALELVVFASEPAPLLCRTLDAAVSTAAGAGEIAELIAQEMAPMANLQGSAETKRAQARALARTMLERMMDECTRGRA
jgi:aerobic carbon-monoxide dehydrogenase medium subunit